MAGHDGKMTFTLAHLSDIHLAPLPAVRAYELIGKRITGYINWRRRRRLIHDRPALDALVADLHKQKPDHIAVTGDIANIALPEEFKVGHAWLESLGTPENVTAIPGNHDTYVRAGLARALNEWGAFMRGDEGESFPFVRRRGPLALIGLNSGVATAPFRATGRLGQAQLAGLPAILDRLKEEGLFRVVLIHHPPVSEAGRSKRLIDAAALLGTLAQHGAELLLHGHDHLHMLNWLTGPNGTRVPAVGVHSASAAPACSPDPAAYHLFNIAGGPKGWTCELISRGLDRDGQVGERLRCNLAPQAN
jgi:3',5'-cyclic AMP phosphodiesterase CpdA